MATLDQKKKLFKAKIAVALYSELARVPKEKEMDIVKGLPPEVNTGRGDALHRRLPRGLNAAREGRIVKFLDDLEWYARALKAARECEQERERSNCSAQQLIASHR